MNLLLSIAFVILSGFAVSQSWKDSVINARKAYFSKDYEKAFNTYAGVKKTSKNYPEILTEQAQSAYRGAKFDASESIYRKCTSRSKDPKSKARSYYNLGNALMKQNKFQEAIRAYRSALKINPFNEQARYNLSQALRKKKRSDSKNNPKNQPDKKDDKNNSDNKKNTDPKDQKKNTRQHPEQKNNKQNQGSQAESSAERLLRKLMKDEAATKQKLNNAKARSQNRSSSTGKDW